MKKLIQTRLHEAMYPVEKRGNCFPTVIACLLDLDSSEEVAQIQEYYDEKSWVRRLTDWLSQRGWVLSTLDGHLNNDSYYLVTGETERGNTHVCIYKNSKLFHDPHPSNKGLVSETHFEYLEQVQVYKTCFRCDINQPLTEFYKHKQMGDGHLNKCKTCTKNDSAKTLKEKISTEDGLEAERARHREKYYRKGYKDVHKPTPFNKKKAMDGYRQKYPEKYKAKIKSQRISRNLEESELHHWNYNIDYAKDILELTKTDHAKLHRFLVYIEDKFIYKTVEGEILDTKEKHINFVKSLGITIYN